jgi:type IV secretory pathway VirB2 component (pilin)
MEEKMFYETSNVSVSNSRFIVDGQTYAMSNVTSVKTGLEKAKKGAGIIIAIIGLVILFGVPSYLWGIIITIVGVLAFLAAKDKYSVILSTSAGENQALISEDKSYIESVVAALNESIVSRG